MNVVGARLSLDDFHFHLFAQLFDDFDNVPAHRLINYFPPVLRRENHMVFTPVTGVRRVFYFIFHLRKTSLLFRDAAANRLDCSTEVLFAKAFLPTPGRTRGFV